MVRFAHARKKHSRRSRWPCRLQAVDRFGVQGLRVGCILQGSRVKAVKGFRNALRFWYLRLRVSMPVSGLRVWRFRLCCRALQGFFRFWTRALTSGVLVAWSCEFVGVGVESVSLSARIRA